MFWQVASSATLGTTTDFQGSIMAMTSITMNTGATIGVGGIGRGGRALAMNGALTLDTNIITPPPAGCAFTAAPTATPVLAASQVPVLSSLPALPDTRLEVSAGTPITQTALLPLAVLVVVAGSTTVFFSSRRHA